MQATHLRHRLKFYSPITERTPTGAVKGRGWEHSFTVWGQFTPLSVKDVLQGQVAQTDITARAKIRYRTDISHAMRVEHTGQMYEIVGEPLADNDSGQEYLTLILQKVQYD